MEKFMIGEQLWYLKSDNKPIYLSLCWTDKQQMGTKNQHIQQPFAKGRIILTQENCNIFRKALERLCKREEILSQGLNNQQLTNLIQRALTKCKRAKNRKRETNCFPVNACFDEECKKARRRWRESNWKKET